MACHAETCIKMKGMIDARPSSLHPAPSPPPSPPALPPRSALFSRRWCAEVRPGEGRLPVSSSVQGWAERRIELRAILSSAQCWSGHGGFPPGLVISAGL